MYIIVVVAVFVVATISISNKVITNTSNNVNDTVSTGSILVRTSFYKNDDIIVLSIIRVRPPRIDDSNQGFPMALYGNHASHILCILGILVFLLCILTLRGISHRDKYRVVVNINSDDKFKEIKNKDVHVKLLRLLIDTNMKSIGNYNNVVYEALRKLCNLGYKFIVQEEVEHNSLIDRLKLEKCIADVEQKVGDIDSIPELRLSELIKTYISMQEEPRNKGKEYGSTTQILANDSFKIIIKGSKSIVTVDIGLYEKLRKGLSEKEVEKLPMQQRILIEKLINEGIVYKDRSGRYRTI